MGGLVGVNNGGTIRNATASGNVTGSSGVGGLVRINNDGTIADTFAVGAVTVTDEQSGDAGGLVGNNRDGGIVEQSYFDTQATGQDSSAGSATRLTTDEMQGTAAEQNMPGLEFGESWQTVSGDYPELIALSDGETDTDTGQDPDTGSDSPLEGAAGEFDADGNSDISIIELGQAGQAFCQR